MRQQRDHDRRVIARCAKRAPRGFRAMAAIGAGVGSRRWWTDTFRAFTADGAVVELAARGTMSRRLAVSLAAHCSGADVSTPWVSRSQPWRPAAAPAAGGLPFA